MKGLSKEVEVENNKPRFSEFDKTLMSGALSTYKPSPQEKSVQEYFKNFNYKYKKRQASNKLLVELKPDSIFFNSRFEWGNLDQVYKISSLDYSLYLKPDYHNSNYCTQWFYFSVRNICKDQTVTFTIKNLVK